MNRAPEEIEELNALCEGGATAMTEGPITYFLVPQLAIESENGVVRTDVLLCPVTHPSGGYPTRLFLAEKIDRPPKTQNWQVHQILARNWHTWSWQGISPDLRLAQILAGHLEALR